LREELEGRQAVSAGVARTPSRSLSHALRNQLNKVGLRLHLLQRQLQVGKADQVDETLSEVLAVLGGMNREFIDLPGPSEGNLEAKPTKCRVLIVEDESNERELLAGLLAMHGCDCSTAADGLEALQTLETGPRPDFVLLDVRMPRCDGPRTVHRLRKISHYNDLRIFAISGTSPRDAGIETGPGGVDAWFPKPLNPRMLCDAMFQGRAQAIGAN